MIKSGKSMKILIIEDDTALSQELKQLLENALYDASSLTDFGNVKEEILSMEPDLVLLDVNLPGVNGFDICQQVRAASDVPVIFVTGRADSMDELNGMLRGGDDYITKPFHAPVLLAHIAAVLKRAKKQGLQEERLFHKGVELDAARGCVRYQGRQAELSKNELKILYCLIRHKNEIVSRARLVEYLWDEQAFIDDNSLSVNIARLRARLEEIGVFDFIKTRRGMGYQV